MLEKERKIMMSKKDKPDLDLDFNELGSMSPAPLESKPIKNSNKKELPKSKFADIVLSIPSKETPFSFSSRTIGDCTGIDFIKWAKNVGYALDNEAKHYDKETNRSDAFVKIVAFHRKNFVLANPDSYKTFH